MSPDPLARVRLAAVRKRRASAALVLAVEDAYAAGVSYAEIAEVLGVSRQAVRQLVLRSSK